MIKNRTVQLIYETIYFTLGLIGCVASLAPADRAPGEGMAPELESKLIITAAGFLGRQIENVD